MNGVEHVGPTSVESFHHDRESRARAAEMPWWRRSKATKLMPSYRCYPGITESGKDRHGGIIPLISSCSLDVVQPTYAYSRGRQERTILFLWQ